MKPLLMVAAAVAFLSGCKPPETGLVKEDEKPLFAGRVESVYFLDETDGVQGYTRFDKGLPGTSTRVKEDVFVEVRTHWVVVKLLNRKDSSHLVPRERIRTITVGTQEGNELNIPKP